MQNPDARASQARSEEPLRKMTNNDLCNLALEIRGALARLRINNPPLNILTKVTRRALLDRVCEREDIKIVIIQGGEKAFFSGIRYSRISGGCYGGIGEDSLRAIHA